MNILVYYLISWEEFYIEILIVSES